MIDTKTIEKGSKEIMSIEDLIYDSTIDIDTFIEKFRMLLRNETEIDRVFYPHISSTINSIC